MSDSTGPTQAIEAQRTRSLRERDLGGRRVRVAASRRSRLLGLAGLDRHAAPAGLLIPRCRAVHTFGMRFAVDLLFLDRRLREVSRRQALAPRRFAYERRAWAVLELPAGGSSWGS